MRCRSHLLSLFVLILIGAGTVGAQVHHVARPDPMEVYFLMDVDRLGDRVRVLYHSLPSLEQQARDGSVLSSNEVNVLPNIQMGGGNIGPTSDGNLVVVDTNASERPGRSTSVVWHKISPGGEILGRGEYTNGGAQVGWGGIFPARGGGIGLTVISSVTREVPRLDTDIDNPLTRTIDGRTVEAEVHSETRLLTSDAIGRRLTLSTALERTFMWGAGFEISKELPPEQKMRLPFENLRIQEEIGLEYGTRTLEHTTDATSDTDRVRPTASGYAMLADKGVRRDRVPPAAGPYYLEVGLDGAILRELYLGPLAEEIGARDFVDFLPMSDGGFLLVGYRTPPGSRRQQLHVTRVDAQGTPHSLVPLGTRGWQLEGIAGTDSNVWLIGHQWSDEHRRNLLVVVKVDLSVAQPLTVADRAAPAAAPPGSAKRADSSAGPLFEAPPVEPSGDCSCSCEEFTELRKSLESMEKLPDEDKMKLISDPAYMKKMECAGKCAIAYGQCMGN